VGRAHEECGVSDAVPPYWVFLNFAMHVIRIISKAGLTWTKRDLVDPNDLTWFQRWPVLYVCLKIKHYCS